MDCRWPAKVKAGTVNLNLVSSVDIADLHGFGGSQIRGYFRGKSFAPMLENPKASIRDYAFGKRTGMISPTVADMCAVSGSNTSATFIRTIQTRPLPMRCAARSFALCKSCATLELNAAQMNCFIKPRPKEELYDLENDPYELNNLAGKPQYVTHLKRLRAELKGWQNARTTASRNLRHRMNLIARPACRCLCVIVRGLQGGDVEAVSGKGPDRIIETHCACILIGSLPAS